jgi:2'-5' RNA ligase
VGTHRHALYFECIVERLLGLREPLETNIGWQVWKAQSACTFSHWDPHPSPCAPRVSPPLSGLYSRTHARRGGIRVRPYMDLMTCAISLKAVNRTADPIRALWDQVALYEGVPSMAALDYPPHITLAVYLDIDPDLLKGALRRVFMEGQAQRLTFTHLRFFDNDPLVLWADPLPSPTLALAHATIHTCIDPAKCHPHYRPGAWIPHCTLGTQIKEEHRAEAIAFTTRSIESFDVLFDVADCVSFPPVAVIEEHVLAGSEQANVRA